MKKQLYRIVTGILAVAWMCLIFSFSNQPATEASKVSGGLCHRLVERANDTLHLDMTEKQQLAMAEKIEYPVRKAAHMTEYFILAITVALPFYVYGLRGFPLLLVAGIICVGFACTDEYHQSFVGGRSPAIRDVCIDSVGAFFGIMVVRIVCWTVLAPSRAAQRRRRRARQRRYKAVGR